MTTKKMTATTLYVIAAVNGLAALFFALVLTAALVGGRA